MMERPIEAPFFFLNCETHLTVFAVEVYKATYKLINTNSIKKEIL